MRAVIGMIYMDSISIYIQYLTLKKKSFCSHYKLSLIDFKYLFCFWIAWMNVFTPLILNSPLR